MFNPHVSAVGTFFAFALALFLWPHQEMGSANIMPFTSLIFYLAMFESLGSLNFD